LGIRDWGLGIAPFTKQGEKIMPTIPGVLTGCAGEHFVAYRLSAKGLLVGLTRGGSPSVDLMVGTADGQKTVAIQVKTKNEAFSKATKSDPTSCWYWQVGEKAAKKFRGKSDFYAFVDLKGGAGVKPTEQVPMPDVFIVPADVVANLFDQPADAVTKNLSRYPNPERPDKRTMFFFHIVEGENKTAWHEAWHLIEDALGISKAGDDAEQS
jgi:hypothetical protein